MGRKNVKVAKIRPKEDTLWKSSRVDVSVVSIAEKIKTVR